MKVQLKNWPNLKVAGLRSREPVEKISGASVPTDFLLEWASGKHYLLKTYGCQANVRDSEIIAAYLEKLGLEETSNPEKADIIILNTCAIREHAESRIRGELGRLAGLARRHRDLVVGLCGCMAQEEEPLAFLKDHFHFLNLVFGTHNLQRIYELLEECVRSKTRVFDVPSSAGSLVFDYPEHRFDAVKAFVNIMYGCDKFCTYCIVPYTRGRQRSRAVEDVVAEVLSLKERGYQEVTLLGQNVNAYGKDGGAEGKGSFAALLEAVAKTNIPRIRFMSSHPADFEEEVFAVMKEHGNIMPSLHLPLQSGSSTILRRMNRRYDRQRYTELVATLRSYLPDVRLTTDLICCFPGETEEDFEETLSIVHELSFASAYNFIYSPRAGTPAARMENLLSEAEKHLRFEKLQAAIDQEAAKAAEKAVGAVVEVLFDSEDQVDGQLKGYDQFGRLIHVKAPRELLGRIVKVLITASHTYSFLGVIEEERRIQ